MIRVERIKAEDNLFSCEDGVWFYRDNVLFAVKEGSKPVRFFKPDTSSPIIPLNKEREWKLECAMYNGDSRAEKLYMEYTNFEHMFMHYYRDKFALR